MIALALYLLKVIICSAILFLYYHLALRNKLFHQWNRFYLLIAVVISLIAPVIQVSVLHHSAEESSKAIRLLQVIASADGYMDEITITAHRSMSTQQWILIGYAVISFALFVSVLLSLAKIYSIIKSHSCKWIENIRFINTNVRGTPFSFFRFIFWNDKIDLSTETGQQIFQHELVHVKEKHSADKLFIQFILAVFWCNPFFWLIRRELKLIHEFIADKKAVGEHGTAALAAMILNASYPAQFNSLTSQFFQTSIKRRIAMLSKIQNPGINYLSRVLALPIVAATVLAFTIKTKIVHTPVSKLEKTVTVVIDAGHGLMPDGSHNGARVGDIYEDEITLAIAKRIKELNTDDRLTIVLTRTSDEMVDLRKRVDFAKENNANLFISIHVNAVPPVLHKDGSSEEYENTNGFEVWVSGKNNSNQRKNEILASALISQLSKIYKTENRIQAKEMGIYVLDKNTCPSALVECGYITNPDDKNFITSKEHQTEIAQKVLQAIESFASNQQLSQTSEVDTVPKTAPQVKEAILKNSSPSTGQNKIYLNSKAGLQKDPLYIVDGKEVSKEELKQFDAEDIESINVFKGPSVKKYGDKGKNGVIEIQMKKNKSSKAFTVQQNGKTVGTGQGKIDPLTNTFQGTFNTESRQLKDTIPDPNQIFTKTEVEASVDKDEWNKFLSKNLQSIIENAVKKGMKAGTYTVNIKFLVKKDGSVADVKAVNDPGYGLADASVAAVQTGPKWSPGIQNGKVVNSYHTQPITFVIQEQ